MSNATRFAALLGLTGAMLMPASASYAQGYIQEDLRPVYSSPQHPVRDTSSYDNSYAYGPVARQPYHFMTAPSLARRGLSPQDWVAINGANQ